MSSSTEVYGNGLSGEFLENSRRFSPGNVATAIETWIYSSTIGRMIPRAPDRPLILANGYQDMGWQETGQV